VGELVAAVEAVPGVEAAAATQWLPLRGSSHNWGIGVEGKPELAETTTAFRIVTPGYFRAMGIELESGRGLLETDRDGGVEEGVVVINQALSREYFPGEDPLGRRLDSVGRWDRIVGVVGNVAEAGLTPDPEPARYVVFEQAGWEPTSLTLVARVRDGLEAAAVLDPGRRAIQAVAPGVAISEQTTMARVLASAIGPALQVRTLLALLAGLALLLGAIGIYGVVSHFVTRRRRDWGIRMVLGMRPVLVVGQIVGRGAALLGAGLALGLVSFLALARLMASFLYGVGPADPLALAAAAGVLVGAGLVAAAVPARRASRVDPAVILRDQ
jgi:hypothetical protein